MAKQTEEEQYKAFLIEKGLTDPLFPEINNPKGAVATVTAKAPTKGLGGGMTPSDFGLDVETADAPLQELSQVSMGDMPVDYEMDIVGNSGNMPNDDDEEYKAFLIKSGLTDPMFPGIHKPKPPRMSLQEFAKTLPEDMSREDRQSAILEFRRDNVGATTGAGSPDKRASDFALGVNQTVLGGGQLVLDALDALGVDSTAKLSEENLAKIQELKAKVHDKDFFSSNTLGQTILNLGTLPIAMRKVVTTALAEGAVGYATARGGGADIPVSILSGVTGGVLTYGVGTYLNRVGGVKALDYMERNVGRHLDLATTYREFAKVTGRTVDELTNHDKVLAIASAGGQEAANVLKEMAVRNVKDSRAIESYFAKPTDALNEQVAANSLATTAKAFKHQTKFAKSAYSELEDLAIAYPNANINLGTSGSSMIDQIMSTTTDLTRSAKLNSALTKLKQENLTMADLLDLRKDLNGIKFKASNLNSKGRSDIDAVAYLDSVAAANLPAEFKPAFDTLRSELAMTYAFTGKNKKFDYRNKLAELVNKIDSGEETPLAVLDKLVRTTGGEQKFNQIHNGIGTVEAINFEKALVKEIMEASDGKLGDIIKRTNKLGFVTPEARNLVNNIQLLDRVFSTEDFYKAVLPTVRLSGLDSASITNDITTKFSYMATAGVWKKIMPYLDPISQSSKGERDFRTVVDSLRKGIASDVSKTKLDAPTEAMYSEFRPVIREAIEQTITDTISVIKGMSKAKLPAEDTKLLEAPADFTVRSDGATTRATGDIAQDALSKEPINTTVVDEANMPSTSVKPREDIIDVEWWKPTSTVVTPDGHVLSMEDLLRGESLPDNMRLPEKADSGIRNFFDMKYKMKTDPDLIKAREEVKKATTIESKGKAKDRLLKQLEYQRLREQGIKPSEAHRMSMKSADEASGALAGGTMSGVTIDDDGNIRVDPEAFLIGMAGGAAVVKGGKVLGK